MAVSATVTLNLGVLKISISEDQLRSLQSRFNRNPLYKGPCMIVNRDKGLSLDSGLEAKSGDHSVLWSPHAAPWQQWRLNSVGGGIIEIVSESSGLRLTTMARQHGWGEVWLDDKAKAGWSTRWRLRAADDGAAFVIQNADSGAALDAGQNAQNGKDPGVWHETHWAAWQQWVIMRLPLS